MPEISEEVVRAAEEAARSVPLRLGPNALQAVAEGRPVRLPGGEAEDVARAALEAIAPLVADEQHLPQSALKGGLQDRYVEVLARWALAYPIPAWGLARGEDAEKLAYNWGRLAARFVADARDEEMSVLRERAERAEAAVTRVRDLHRPTEGLGYDCDEDPTPGSYGRIDRACTSCGTAGEYAVRWPCPTVRALDGLQEEDGPESPPAHTEESS